MAGVGSISFAIAASNPASSSQRPAAQQQSVARPTSSDGIIDVGDLHDGIIDVGDLPDGVSTRGFDKFA